VNEACHRNAARCGAVRPSRLHARIPIRSLEWSVGPSNPSLAESTAGRSGEQLFARCDSGLPAASREALGARLVAAGGVG